MKFATFNAAGGTFFGAITDQGAIALNEDFPNHGSLYEVIAAGAFDRLKAAVEGKSVTHTDFTFEMVMPDARRILCVGVNFPDRNAEYKDGSAQPQYMSLFPRFASGFTGHNRPLIRPPENHTLDYEGEVAIVIEKQAEGFHRLRRITISLLLHCATKERSATGCVTPSSMSPKVKTGTNLGAWPVACALHRCEATG